MGVMYSSSQEEFQITAIKGFNLRKRHTVMKGAAPLSDFVWMKIKSLR